MQDSLPAGGLRLYREGVEPSGPLRKVSGHIPSSLPGFVLSQVESSRNPFFASRPQRVAWLNKWRRMLFYNIELAPLADGRVYVAMLATTVDDEEPQLLTQEIASDTVATIEDALAVIRQAIEKV